MIHPRLATMLAIVTTDYPLRSGEAGSLLRAAVDASFNRISVDGECSTNDAVVLLANGAACVERSPAGDAELAAALETVCASLARQIVEDGEGATVLLEIECRRRVLGGGGRGGRAADRHVAARQDGCVRARSELGARARSRGLGTLERRLCPRSIRTCSRSRFDGTVVFADGSPTGRDPGARRRSRPDRARPRARDGIGLVPRLRPDVRLRAAERRVHDMTRVVLKLGGRVAVGGAPQALELHRMPGTRWSSSTEPVRRSRPSSHDAGSGPSSWTAAASRMRRPSQSCESPC